MSIRAYSCLETDDRGKHMGVPQDCQKIETRLTRAGASVGALCTRAGIARSTWQRWKSETTAPNMGTWTAVLAAVDALAPEQDAAPLDNEDAALSAASRGDAPAGCPLENEGTT
jgi:hypothetical protein